MGEIRSKMILSIVISVLIQVLLFFTFQYFTLTTLSFNYTDIYFSLAFHTALGVVCYFICMYYMTKLKQQDILSDKSIGIYIISIVAFILVVGVIGFMSTELFHANEYKDLLNKNADQNIKEVLDNQDFNSDYEIDDLSIPIVDKSYAELLASQNIEEGTSYTLGEFHDIYADNTFYSIAPLEYNGFFKWMNKKSIGTPGYVLVNKNTQEVELVNVEGGLHYLESAYFGKDLYRHVYYEGYNNAEIIDFALEIDDTKKPYLIGTQLSKNIGLFGGDDVQAVIVVDPVNGDTTRLTPEQVVSGEVVNGRTWDFIDTVYPYSLVEKQINDYASLQKGYFNTVFSKEGVLQTTPGSRRIVYDGNVYHYTSLTSVSSDETSVATILVNTQTKETRIFRMIGATEAAAQKAARDNVSNYDVTASFPVLLNKDGKPTYFMTLKGESGYIVKYGYVQLDNITNVETPDAPADSPSSGDSSRINNTGTTGTAGQATISNINIVGNYAYIQVNSDESITLKDKDNNEVISTESFIVFKVLLSKSNYLYVTEIGDIVSFTYINDSEYENNNIQDIIFISKDPRYSLPLDDPSS